MLSVEELNRYSRQICLPEIGEEGQKRLRRSRVLVVGAGGLGCPALLYLAAAGVGEIAVVDDDIVDESNLQRQVLFRSEDIGRLKVACAGDHLLALNPHLKFLAIADRLSVENVREILPGYDIVLDGSDSFATRYLVNDACVEFKIPFIAGAIFQFEGQLSLFNALTKDGKRGPTYRCLFPEPPDPAAVPPCAEAGVLGVLPGIIGVLQASEALKYLLEIGEPLSGKLVLFHLLQCELRSVAFKRRTEGFVEQGIRAAEDYVFTCRRSGTEMPDHNVKEIEVESLKARLDNDEELLLIDIREPFEREIVHIGGTLIPMGQLLGRESELPDDRDVVLYCRSGGRSYHMVQELQKHTGRSNLYNLRGGVLEWAEKVDPSLPRY